MADLTPELTTVALAKTYMGVTSSADDTLLAAILIQAERILRDLMDRPLGWTKQVVTETFDGEDSDRIVLTYTPVDSTYTSQAVTLDGVAVDTASYVFDNTNGIVGLKGTNRGLLVPNDNWGVATFPRLQRMPDPRFNGGYQNLAVTYRGGYDAADIPTNLSLATQMIIKWIYQQRTRDPGMSAETLGQYSYTSTEDAGWAGLMKFIGTMLGKQAQGVFV